MDTVLSLTAIVTAGSVWTIFTVICSVAGRCCGLLGDLLRPITSCGIHFVFALLVSYYLDFKRTAMLSDQVNVRYLVEDVDVAIDFYTKHLGFTLGINASPAFADVIRGNLRLLLSGRKS